MYCPKCGHLQASEAIKFCAKCGLPLENVTQLVTSGNAPMGNEKNTHKGQLSPRIKGILQGIAIVPGSIGAWFVLDIFYEGVFGAGMMGGLYAMLTLILLVALVRVLYAIFFEESSVLPRTESSPPHVKQSEMGAITTNSALPLSTSEIGPPLSITEKTTRQLEGHR
jgi:hypothetical protein